MDQAPARVQQVTFEGIGASDSAAAAGVNPWKPPIVLWEQLVGLRPRSQEENAALEWGKRLEGAVRQKYADDHACVVEIPAESIFREDDPWKRATPDGIVVQEGSGRWLRGLEVKTSSQYLADDWGPSGSDDIPIQYRCQVAWSMHVTGLDRWDVAALIGGRDYRVYEITRDMQLEAELVDAVEWFWHRCVVMEIPPPADHTDEFRRHLERRWPEVRADYLPATPELEELVATIQHVRGEIDDYEQDLSRLKNQLREAIGDTAGLVTTLGKIHWKPEKQRKSISWEAVAREIASRTKMSERFLLDLADGFTVLEAPRRPLKLPNLAR